MHKKVPAYFIGVSLMSFAFSGNTNAEIIPVNLRCEYLANPQGLDVKIPRLSWKLKATDPNQRGQKQTAWQVLVASSETNLKANKGDLWDSSKVESDQTIHVEYAGKPLRSRMRCYWKVRVWDKDGTPSAWSQSAIWSMGLLEEADWQAQWIAADTYVPPQPPTAASITGYHSAVSKSPDDAKWVAIDLGKVQRINAVRLFPTAPWGTKVKPGYMFPVRFKIEAAQRDDFSDSKIVVDQTEKDVPRPETEEAQRYDFEPVEARHVRLMATRLRDDGFGFGFTVAEMEVLSDEKNVAEGGTVTALDEFVHTDWSKARLVDGKAAPELAETFPQFRPNPMLRKEFEIAGPIRRATAYVTGMGLYELRINGHRVEEERLAPQWTHYSHRVLYQTCDVTGLLQEGANAVGAVLGDGWYRLGAFGTGDTETFWRPYGDAVQRLLLQMEIELEDGTTQTVVSDETWEGFMDGPLRKATIYDGVEYDARKEIDGWDQPRFDDSTWKPVVIAEPNWALTLSAQMNEPIRVVKEKKPIAMCEPEPGVYVFDLGQNLAGVCRITLNGLTSSTVQLRHAEALKATGMLYRDNLSGVGGTGDMAESTDTYVLKGDGPEVFEPPFTYHGFRYAEVTYKPSADGELPAKPDLNSLTALAIGSDVRHVGEFECSDPTLSKLWQNIYWTYRSNMMSVVSDCAARAERWGWMGDGQESWQTICYTLDVGAFGTKWVRDMHDSQHPDGLFTCASPGTGYAPGWSDAGVIIPWISYVNYGDKRLIEMSYEPAKRYIEAILKDNSNYLWQKNIPKGDAYRDWLDARTVSLQDEWKALHPAIPTIPQDVFATAFWAYSTRLVSKMAAVLGKDDEMAYYSELADNIKAAFIKAYVSDDGHIQDNVQSCYALALGFGLLNEKYEALAVKHLLEAVKAHGNRLSTGIHSTKQLLLCLSKYGHHDLACHLVARPCLPSWGYMVASGATTIWERFDSYKSDKGFNPHPMNALNHVGFSSVGQWMFGEILGINPDESKPGYKHFIVRPRMGRGLTWARGSYDSIRGTIKTEWKCENDQFILNLTVPPNTTATVYIPTEDINAVKETGKPASEAEGITYLRTEGDTAVFHAVSGSYHFSASLSEAVGLPES